jgi:multidrug efflux pump subunit AcrA (membrane-fusion protein)
MKKRLLLLPVVLLPLALIGWGSLKLSRAVSSSAPATTLPTTHVKRGDVTITVAARGDLQGGNSEMLIAPMVAGNDMAITMLRTPGELVNEGDVVVQFDTTEQAFKLREAEADLAEAEQKVAQAQAESEAKEEETRYSLLQAKTDVRLAELDARRNPLLALIVARQNILAVEAARDKLRQIEQDIASRKATTEAGLAIQEAARNKAKVAADTARRNIESMTLKAKSSGYVNIQQNTFQNMMFWGMTLPIFQVGDTVRPGMAVAQIPDMRNWDVTARIGELDRGHLAIGQKAAVTVVALPGKTFTGKIKEIGGTTGPPWDRRFDCKIGLDNPSPEMRAGMSTRIVITTGMLPNVLWLPSQALFESDGRTFLYAQGTAGFVPRDVKLVRRSESQVVITGVNEGQLVALSSPDQATKKAAPAGGAMKALSK